MSGDAAPIEALLARALVEHPDLVGDRDARVRDLSVRLADVDVPLESLVAGDLLLALACTHGEPEALARFDARYGPIVESVLAGDRSVDPGELKQRVWERLFVGTLRRGPRIADYAGKGPLRNWLLVLAARVRTDLQRAAGKPSQPLDLAAAAPDDDPELAYLKARYRSELELALREAIEELSARQRTVLALALVDRLDTNGIAALYRVHRTSAGRWVAEAKQALADHTKQRLAARLSASPGEIDSVLRLIASRMHVTFGPLLREG